MQSMRSLFTIMLLILAAALGHSAQAKIFTSNSGYRISTPNSWITKLGPHDSKYAAVFYCAAGKDGRPALPIVEIATRPQEAMTMQKLVSLGPYMVNGTFPGFHQVSATYTPLNGVSALDIRGTYPRAGRTIYVRELFAIRAGEAYMITTAYPQAQRNICEPVCKSVIESVRWQ